jgi:hypothetical protein
MIKKWFGKIKEKKEQEALIKRLKKEEIQRRMSVPVSEHTFLYDMNDDFGMIEAINQKNLKMMLPENFAK